MEIPAMTTGTRAMELHATLKESTEKLKDDNRQLVNLLQTGIENIRKNLQLSTTSRSSKDSCGRLHVDRIRADSGVSTMADDALSICHPDPSKSKIARTILSQPRDKDEQCEEPLNTRKKDLAHETGRSNYVNTMDLLQDSSNIRSILQRRKIIDDNVKVASKYDHSPVVTPKTGRKSYKSLAHSYSSDDSDVEDSFFSVSSSIQDSSKKTLESGTKEKEQLYEKTSELLNKKLLLDAGNDRRNANIIKEIEKRPKNTIFDLNAEESPCTHFDRSTKKFPDYKRSLGATQTSRIREAEVTYDGRTLLGYDWIAGVLENADISDPPAGLLEELKEFRKTNKEECVGPESLFEEGIYTKRPISPQIQDPGHTCIHGYTVNERLYTQPVNMSDNGSSVCPVCLADRKRPTKVNPGFVRVSIPKSLMKSETKNPPATRKTYDPTDSLALSKHCLAGWQNSKPIAKPPARTFDIKDNVMAKQSTTLDEVEQMAQMFSRMGRLLESTPDLDPNHTTQLMMDSSHALIRYELQTAYRHAAPNLPIATWQRKYNQKTVSEAPAQAIHEPQSRCLKQFG